MKNILKISMLALASGVMLIGCDNQPSSTSTTTSAPASSTSEIVKVALPEMRVYHNMKYKYDSPEYTLVVHRVGLSYLHEYKVKALGESSEENFLRCYVFDSVTNQYKAYSTKEGVTVANFTDVSCWNDLGKTVSEDIAVGKSVITQDDGAKAYKKTDNSDKVTFSVDGKSKEVTTTKYLLDTYVPYSYYWYSETGLFSLPVKIDGSALIESCTSLISDVDTTITSFPGSVVLPTA